VLKVIEPVQLADPSYDGHRPPPVEGELLQEPGGGVWSARVALGKRSYPAAKALLGADPGYIKASLQEGYAKGAKLRRVQHLSQAMLEASDFMDLSGLQMARIAFAGGDSGPTFLTMGYLSRDVQHLGFPLGTSGFLYFHPGTAGPISAHLRFRVTGSSDPASFDAGQDLLMPFGVPWKHNLTAVFRGDGVGEAANVLLREGLVTEADIARWKRTPVHSLGEIVAEGTPFRVDCKRHYFSVHLVRGEEVTKVNVHSPFWPRTYVGPHVAPYRGKHFRFRTRSDC
jgi:hypothetical protein